MTRSGKLSLIALGLAIPFVFFIVFNNRTSDNLAPGMTRDYTGGVPSSSVPSQPSYAARTITTADATYSVPGTAYMDGTDPKAMPPATLMNVHLWDNAPRTRHVGSLRHGTQVDLIEAREVPSEHRYYFHVRAEGVEGWIPETFLSPYCKDPIGDQF